MENNNRQGCRWVKASEELFYDEDWRMKHLRYKQDKVKLDTDLFEVRNWYLQKIGGSGKLPFEEIEYLDESICATSSENYWKQRCEAAEKVIINETNDGYSYEDYRRWLNLSESTPSPTGDRDCEELKKEVERLKGLIEKCFFEGGYSRIANQEEWQEFKTENNI